MTDCTRALCGVAIKQTAIIGGVALLLIGSGVAILAAVGAAEWGFILREAAREGL